MKNASALNQLYKGLERAHGAYYPGDTNATKNKVEGRAETAAGPATPELWKKHLDGRLGLGVVPICSDDTCCWGAIDIDQYPLDLDQLFRQVVRYDLPLAVIRTKSGGAHLTCFTTEAVAAKLMRGRLSEMAVALGYPAAEIFPKQVSLASEKDVGNWLNMPYFDSAHTTRYAVNKGHQLSVEQFLAYVDQLKISPEELENFIIRTDNDAFTDGPPCLQTLARSGLAPGTRNEAMFAFGVYCRKKYGDEGWIEQFMQLNSKLCDPPLPPREIASLVKSLSRKNYFYTCKRPPLVSVCNKEICLTREFGVGQQPGELNVMLGPLVKIDHVDSPTWIIDVGGVRFELETTQLMNQNEFHRLCIEHTNRWPNTLKPFQWEEVVNERLSNIEVITPPEDSSTRGRFLVYLEQFLTTTALSRTVDELLQGKPWTEDGMTYFRSNDLMDYLERQHFRGITQRQVWNILRHSGVVHKQFRIKGRCVQTWGVKEYERQNEPHDVPDFEDKPEF